MIKLSILFIFLTSCAVSKQPKETYSFNGDSFECSLTEETLKAIKQGKMTVAISKDQCVTYLNEGEM